MRLPESRLVLPFALALVAATTLAQAPHQSSPAAIAAPDARFIFAVNGTVARVGLATGVVKVCSLASDNGFPSGQCVAIGTVPPEHLTGNIQPYNEGGHVVFT